MTAMNPQITKSYAAGDFDYMNKLMARGAKYATILYWFIALTVFVEADVILEIWLVEVPSYASIFLRLTIICSIFQALSNTLYIGMLATGNIKKYQIVIGSIYIGSFVLCYVLFKLGLGPEYGYISTLVALFIALFVRLLLIREMISEFSIKVFVNQAIIKSIIVVLLSTGFVFLIKHFVVLSNRYLELTLMLAFSMFSVAAFSLLIALSTSEKNILRSQIVKMLKK
jgi:Na+-driven multidrug efflux pump